MTNVFVYGTLRHVPLLAAVLGKESDALELRQGRLADHAVFAVKGQDFPILKPAEGQAEGLFIGDLSDTEIERLRFYEGSYDYDLTDVSVTVDGTEHPARVFKSDNTGWVPDRSWSLDTWAARFGEVTVLRAIEEMGYFGQRSREDVDRMLPMIKARATAKMQAKRRNDAVSPSGMTAADVSDVTLTRPYSEFFTMEEFDLSFRRYDGARSDMVKRAVFVATDAVIVLPYDPVRDRVLLIEQFRPGPFARGDDLPWQLEPIAGRLDAEESPESCARREAQEEAGLALTELHEVANCYASPGCSTEFYNIYLGLADLPDEVVGVSGLEQEAEDIRSYVYSFDALMQMVDRMQIVNAPLVLAALWLARHRDRLRGTA
ncbi:NUDIX domain-containing protein [Shimia sp. MIT1388]|uniref:NUDIX domain-containing protein n=1 Tax=Shimia sp. MIT1388 TaxID=3096992 RepID=UPI00399BEB43